MAKSLMEFYAEHGDPAVLGIAKVINNISQLMPRLPIKRIEGLLEKHGSSVYEGGVTTRAVNLPFPATDNSKINPILERCCIAGAQVKTDVRLGQIEQANEIARRSRAISRFIDWLIYKGRGTTDQKEIVGLNDRLTGNQDISAATNGAPMTVTMLEDLIDAVEDQGAGRFVVLNQWVARDLKRDIMSSIGGAGVADFTATVGKYEGVDIVITARDHDGKWMLDFDEQQGTCATTASAYCFAPGTSEDCVGAQIVMASNSIEIINEYVRDSQKIDTVEVAFGLALYHPRCAARLKGLTKGDGE